MVLIIGWPKEKIHKNRKLKNFSLPNPPAIQKNPPSSTTVHHYDLYQCLSVCKYTIYVYALDSTSSFKMAPSTLSLFNLFLFYTLLASPYACVFNSHFVHSFVFFAYFFSLPISFGPSYRISNVLSPFFYNFFLISFENNKKKKERLFSFSFNSRRWLHSNVVNDL